VNIITLTTDFGTRDWFVGAMKGVMLGVQPKAIIVDLTHDIAGGDVRGGAFSLMSGYSLFPKGTVHVAVVDPGVGGPRQAIAVQTADYYFVGPDNGIFSFALAREKIKSVHQLENETFFLKPISRTFHGRDVFAPVAAHLSRGVAIEKLGPARKDFVRLDWPRVQVSNGRIEGEVVYVDRFGNLITNVDAESLRSFGNKPCEVFAGKKRLCRIAPYYAAVPVGRPLALTGSTGFLEIAVNGASAADKFRLHVGHKVSIRRWFKPC
jgi:S-adenosylmethionine hydrolase